MTPRRLLRPLRGQVVGVLSVVALCVLGIVNLVSADFYSGDSFHRFQLVAVLCGALACAFVAWVDLRWIERLAYPIFGLLVLALAATLALGRTVNNSTRWVVVGGFQLQPSEFMKIALILAVARHVHRNPPQGPFDLRTLWRPGLLIALPSALVIVQPDLGTTLVLAAIAVSMLLFHGVRLRTALLLFGLVLLAVPVAWERGFIHDYQKDRVQLWLNADALDPKNPEHKRILDKNLQTEQSLWAVGSGQVFGKGLKGGQRSRLKYLPELHTDFIVATFAEEHGFVGCAALALLYYLIVLWCLGVARAAKEPFGALVAAGVGAFVFWHFVVNVGMVLGVLPVVGLPLPLLSRGGSSAMSMLIGVGLVLNVSASRVRIG